MFISTENEIVSLMPTARWNRPDQLKGYLEEEERVTLEPLLGTPLYEHLCKEYERLCNTYVDITSSTIKPVRKAKHDPATEYADVTERINSLSAHGHPRPGAVAHIPSEEDTDDVPEKDMQTIRVLRICQQIEFYKMLSHKAGLLTVSFNEGGGMNVVTADGYDGADEKAKDRVVKDAFMSAGRAVDSLLLFLEADAKGLKLFTELWQHADAFYLHKDLLFQTARVLNEYLDIKGERMAYVQLVRDIRFCQNTFLKPRIGGKLLKAVVAFLNDGITELHAPGTSSGDGDGGDAPAPEDPGTSSGDGGDAPASEDPGTSASADAMDELAGMLRTALAFYVEARRVEIGPKNERLARRDSMADAQQAMAMAEKWIEDNLDVLGDAAVDTPIYNAAKERQAQAEQDAADACASRERLCRQRMLHGSRKLFTAFPATHRTPEYK